MFCINHLSIKTTHDTQLSIPDMTSKWHSMMATMPMWPWFSCSS